MAEKRTRYASAISGKKVERERYELRRRTQEELYRAFNKISDLKRGMVWIEKKICQSQKKADPLDVLISEELAISVAALLAPLRALAVMAAPGLEISLARLSNNRRARNVLNPTTFPYLLSMGYAPLLEVIARRPQNITPETLEGIYEICTWLSRELVKTCSSWNEVLDILKEPAKRTVRNAYNALLDEADWLLEDQGPETPDAYPERLVTAVEEIHQQTHKVLKSLEMCVGEGIEQTKQAALAAQEAANHAALRLRQKLEASEIRKCLS